jgi:hypothetical protein
VAGATPAAGHEAIAMTREELQAALEKGQREFLFDVGAVMLRFGAMTVDLSKAIGVTVSRDEAIEAMRKFVDEQLSDLHG